MKASFLDQTADIFTSEAEAVPVRATAWGIVDIEPDGVLEEGQDAGIAVYIDLGAIAFEVSLTTDEVIKALARAESPSTQPEVELVRIEKIEPEPEPEPEPYVGDEGLCNPGKCEWCDKYRARRDEAQCDCPDVEDLV